MTHTIKLVMAQQNFLVGDIEGNADKIIQCALQARDQQQADLIVFPELSICGYPPEDLLLRNDIYVRVEHHLERIMQACDGIDIVLGYPRREQGQQFNCAGLIRDGKVHAQYHKMCLPNYSVFDEQRYFIQGTKPCVFEINNTKIALGICEDMWHPHPIALAKDAGAELMVFINASPFDRHKPTERQDAIMQRAQEANIPIMYVNLVGGQDELVFDGGSMVADHTGQISHHAPFFEEVLEQVTCEKQPKVSPAITSQRINPDASEEQRMYNALVLGVRDYIEKNGFKSAIIGLSGGIDSALTVAIAVDAIGADRVETIMMPSRYTSDMSLNDATEQCALLGVQHHTISIEQPFDAFLATLADEFKGMRKDATEENIQARCRGIILMAISNKKGAIVLSTGNKSELSVGYATLYGDMVGGFCVLKDLPKHWVYRLANYRNALSRVIPQNVIDRPPTAELAPNQLDQDTLPPYDILDQILELYIEHDRSPQFIIEQGFTEDTVRQVVKMVDRNEYKRHQAPVGVRLSSRAFGKDRRYPITSGYHSDI